MNVIPCITWVKRGVAAANPSKVELTPKELEEIIKRTESDLNDLKDELDEDDDACSNSCVDKSKTEASKSNLSQSSDEFDFDKYDDESGDIHCNIANIVTFGEDGKDPLVTADFDDDDSEKEDDIIKPDDNLVLVGHVEGDASILEIFVYNEAEGSFYCHHDILLPSFPLCLEWLNFDPTDPKPGNLCAIGTMEPVIEIWDLDMVNCLASAYKLGRKPNKKKKLKRIGHKDAVLDIAWNQNYMHVLASGSVDETVLLWDLETGKPATKLDTFRDKVQSLKWHPFETHHLLVGSADRVVRLFDCKEEKNVKNWEASGEVERVIWNHFDSNYCIASTDNGYIDYIDVRKDSHPVWSMNASEKEIAGLSLSSACKGLLISSSSDGVIKVWDIVNNEAQLVWEKKTNLGALQCLASNPDNPFIFAVGGDNKAHNLKVIDLRDISEVHNNFKGRLIDSGVTNKNTQLSENIEQENEEVEMMDVTEDMEYMAIDSPATVKSKKKRNKKKNQVTS